MVHDYSHKREFGNEEAYGVDSSGFHPRDYVADTGDQGDLKRIVPPVDLGTCFVLGKHWRPKMLSIPYIII